MNLRTLVRTCSASVLLVLLVHAQGRSGHGVVPTEITRPFEADVPQPPKVVLERSDGPHVHEREFAPEGGPGLPQPVVPQVELDAAGTAMAAASDLVSSHLSALAFAGMNRSTATLEPTVASPDNLRTQFATGNFFASYSIDQGSTWLARSPYTTFPALAGGFCCDQWAVSRNGATFWYIQYAKNTAGNAVRGTREGGSLARHPDGRGAVRARYRVPASLAPILGRVRSVTPGVGYTERAPFSSCRATRTPSSCGSQVGAVSSTAKPRLPSPSSIGASCCNCNPFLASAAAMSARSIAPSWPISTQASHAGCASRSTERASSRFQARIPAYQSSVSGPVAIVQRGAPSTPTRRGGATSAEPWTRVACAAASAPTAGLAAAFDAAFGATSFRSPQLDITSTVSPNSATRHPWLMAASYCAPAYRPVTDA